ncbi:nuclear transport factor 2 family protein [Burkholderia multivorans]|uniref:nuclear transport factor 2 family protein n=1 Tax=Burkholderia multivorans TaxID=87883 RepID=UPI0009E0CE45|nr:nuclear transport factor 2 family protein [Burkholderia multivorans]MBU9149495.1 nuclear transport factor 2 family protein [Burkholderia multivorans]MBU9314154.1 nuclear transport factor 2 family protein [Burkholderia multivorans]MBU9482150.1 nuclear transport factor 2 family protein [Burkholderia multivorans]MCA8248630.1 nuclear transport factor 2 family protein [Burkholderia multivorans]MCA8501416.1 nuclear transport factor 2 family protein [Burkholderia multivorans]
MTSSDADADARARRIHDDWHAAVVARDLDALMALYADDAVLETPLIVVTLPAHGSGVLHGKAAIGAFFAAGLRDPRNRLGRWYRTGVFFSNGRQLTWEYPRATPDGDQVDLVEVMELRDGLIAHHRVYWGWVGFQALTAAAAARDRG